MQEGLAEFNLFKCHFCCCFWPLFISREPLCAWFGFINFAVLSSVTQSYWSNHTISLWKIQFWAERNHHLCVRQKSNIHFHYKKCFLIIYIIHKMLKTKQNQVLAKLLKTNISCNSCGLSIRSCFIPSFLKSYNSFVRNLYDQKVIIQRRS